MTLTGTTNSGQFEAFNNRFGRTLSLNRLMLINEGSTQATVSAKLSSDTGNAAFTPASLKLDVGDMYVDDEVGLDVEKNKSVIVESNSTSVRYWITIS